ncbi:MAG: helix-turn-helix domain-containing protein [Thermodesulfobacteriota bacterium]
MVKKQDPPYINVDYFQELTGEIDTQNLNREEALGERIRNIRLEKGIELDALAEMTGFSIQDLRSIENGEFQPQLGAVMKLSQALDAALGRIISGEGEKSYVIVKKDERQPVARSATSTQKLYTYYSLASEVKGRNMEPLIVQLEETEEEEKSVHSGEEFIFVLNGKVKVEIGEEEYELNPGDSTYYLSTTPHKVTASEGKATILAVLCE